MNASVLGLSKEEIDQRFDDIAAFADIGEFIKQPVKSYSSGMMVRLAFAVQACVSPQILVVDEALSVGDEKFQRKCFDYIERLREGGCSILLVTHSTATVEKFCQRGILLHGGETHGIGAAKEIVDQYHALLYSDEKAYFRYRSVNREDKEIISSSDKTGSFHSNNTKDNASTGLVNTRAAITEWGVFDIEGNPCEQFKVDEIIKIQLFVDVLNHIGEIQAGILIRTVEGVSAFGTSTLYHDKNYINAQRGDRLKFDFELKASLCAGNYFVTLSIAEAISHGDMLYLDRKTDVTVIKINQLHILASGIAMLETTVAVNKVESEI